MAAMDNPLTRASCETATERGLRKLVDEKNQVISFLRAQLNGRAATTDDDSPRIVEICRIVEFLMHWQGVKHLVIDDREAAKCVGNVSIWHDAATQAHHVRID